MARKNDHEFDFIGNIELFECPILYVIRTSNGNNAQMYTSSRGHERETRGWGGSRESEGAGSHREQGREQ